MQPQVDFSKLSLHEQDTVRANAAEIAETVVESLRLYEPLPWQERFHRCRRRECVVTKGNQVGGSISHFVEAARAVTRQDPYGKYPQSGVCVIIGYGEKHIGNTVYKYLFTKGHNKLRIIKDETTGRWRMYRNWLGVKRIKQDDGSYKEMAGDKHRVKDSQPAPPLIPERFYDKKKAFSWVKQRQKVFAKVELNTGWTILAFNSQGDPRHAQGFQADLVLIDEDLADSGWYTEMFSRTMVPAQDGAGFLRWNVMPHGETNALMELLDRCEEELELPDDKRTTELLEATVYDNPYLDDQEREVNIRKWKRMGEEIYNQRALGKVTLGERLMYPRFHRDIHGLDLWELPGGNQEKGIAGDVPYDWTHYLVIDPGVTPGSVGFFAVPPPSAGYGRIVLMYDELEIADCTARKLAVAVKAKMGSAVFQDFIIDWHGSRSKETGSGIAIYKQYLKEFEGLRISCVRRGIGFAKGSDDVNGRSHLLRDMLWSDANDPEDTTPAFFYLHDRCPKFELQMKRYKKKVAKHGGETIVLDTPNVRGIHLPVISEYMAAYRPRYIKPNRTHVVHRLPAIQERMDALRASKKRGKSVVCLN